MKLEHYLRINKINVITFARKLGRSRMAIYRYFNGAKPDDNETMQKIYDLTKGQVDANDFYDLKTK